jgi:predicted O-methyltransferase YrrM
MAAEAQRLEDDGPRSLADRRVVQHPPAPATKSEYNKFFRKFGRAYRTKHVRLQPANPVLRVLAGLWGGPGWAVRRNCRPYYLPPRTGLPKEFIRLDPWEGQYVFMIASLAKVGILEIGRFNGGSAFLMACANREAPIYSVDLAPKDDQLVRSLFRRHDVGRNVDLIVGDSQRQRSPRVGRFDVLFVDGDHSYEGCTRDCENWFPKLEPGGHVIFHDAYQGSEVQPAAIDFIARNRNSVSVVVPPYIPADHWHLPVGSIVHVVKHRAG